MSAGASPSRRKGSSCSPPAPHDGSDRSRGASSKAATIRVRSSGWRVRPSTARLLAPLLGLALCPCTARGACAHPLVGIDLGTTNSAVALLRDKQPVVLANRHGDTLTPSTVAYAADGVVVGREAVAQASANVANTIHSAKRFMGRQAAECGELKVGFEVAADDDGGVVFRCPANPELIRPEEVGAQVLLELLDQVESVEGARPHRAVVTVPAYYREPQRLATVLAGRLAGLQEVTLLSEPVAASLAFGLGGATGKVLVFDLGAGTFDVSVLSLDGSGSIEVLASSGDARLGGNDFDAVIVEWLCQQAEERGLRPRADGRAMRRLREWAEAAKIRLSVLKSVRVLLPGTEADQPGAAPVLEVKGDDTDASRDESYVLLSRSLMETLCEPLLQRLKAPLYEVALSAGVALPGEYPAERTMRKQKGKARSQAKKLVPEGPQKYLPRGELLSEIVLVGGATHTVAVRKLLANLFGVSPRRTVEPMQAVALGAAVYAGMRDGVLPGRVLQPWQAQLGRLLDRAGGSAELGSAEADLGADALGGIGDLDADLDGFELLEDGDIPDFSADLDGLELLEDGEVADLGADLDSLELLEDEVGDADDDACGGAAKSAPLD